MMHLLTFRGPAVGLTRATEYQVMHLESVGRVQLWYREFDGKWTIGHGKDIPAGMTAGDVAETMRQFIIGDIDHVEYGELLP